ncbi:Transposase IS116/IS110/IS902 family protein [Micromonospora purpureochromogenes]|uniref:Transposase IS116/IS110/IS902 family protein n=1 Tax=Micromonospora purpureochromogenes TaxID=47872 RepID=A0A1C4YV19_9ACTN|nr:Transposase IS116/IS110/IS902 family protein [Micromonospora purpureochromogenes]
MIQDFVEQLPPGFTDTFQSRFVEVNDIALHAVIGGSGPVLLLLPGTVRPTVPITAVGYRWSSSFSSSSFLSPRLGSTRVAGWRPARVASAGTAGLPRAINPRGLSGTWADRAGRRRSCPALPTACARSCGNAARSPQRSRGCLMRTLCPGPDLDARHRRQDRRQDPARSRRRHRLPDAGPPGRLRRTRPVARRSGSSIRGEHPPRGGNKNLKRALLLAAFAVLADPTGRAYYDRKRAEGNRHNAALICLARRRCDVLYAMLRDKIPYQPPPAAPIAA